MEKLFIGGFGGCGSRAIMLILKKAGYYVGEPLVNTADDYLGLKGKKSFLRSFDRYYLRDSNIDLLSCLRYGTSQNENWALKHGQMMYIIDDLKKWFPESKFIYVFRNQIDQVMNGYFDEKNKAHTKYGNLPVKATIEEKANWVTDQSNIAIPKADYVIKLEDLCANKEFEIKRLLDFIKIKNYNIEGYLNLIIMPESIGRGSKYYDVINVKKINYK